MGGGCGGALAMCCVHWRVWFGLDRRTCRQPAMRLGMCDPHHIARRALASDRGMCALIRD